MESFTPESIVVRLIADKPVRKTPYQVKGVFMKQFSDEKIVIPYPTMKVLLPQKETPT